LAAPIPVVADVPSAQPGLGFLEYAEAISDAIRGGEPPQFTIGLYGAWGSGKSSLLNAIGLYLSKKGSNVIPIRFDAWRYEKSEHIVVPLLHKVYDKAQALRDDKITSYLKRALESVIFGLNFNLSAIGGPSISGKDIKSNWDSQGITSLDQAFSRPFNDLQKLPEALNGRRIAVLIDDLDRCSPENVVSVLESINLIMDIPGFIFVLALDYDVLINAIKIRYPHVSGDSFIQKMVQLPFRVPPINLEAPSFLSELIPTWAEWEAQFPAGFSQYARDIAMLGLEANPRQIKRLINSYLLLSRIIEQRNLAIEPQQLAALIGVQLRWPSRYRDFQDAVLAEDPDPFQTFREDPDEPALQKYAGRFFDRKTSGTDLKQVVQLTAVVVVDEQSEDESPSIDEQVAPAPAQSKITVARLPVTGLDLIGREAELQRLDEAWANPRTNIIAFVAWGGVGKTALVNNWLKQRMAREDYRGAERVYGWSFYSQGTSERAASADLFVNQALRWFGDADPAVGSPWDKGERLAGLIRQSRTLLVLDGLEPLQYPPGPQEGRLKDAALQALLVELAAGQPGLCVISTRERVGDLMEFEDGTVVQVDLEQLSPRSGAQLLRSQGVMGDDDELQQAATEYGGHALALTLLGSYLADVYGGDIRRRNEIQSLEEAARYGRQAEGVMRGYEKWLGQGVELAVLRLLGVFDRPAEAGSIAALRAAPTIPELTDALQGLSEREWQQALAKLRRVKLLASPSESGTLDTHPLVREHFRQQLKRDRPEAWREANNRLYEHLKRTAKEFPDSIEEMSPLYAAVSHGCAAGRYQDAYEEVYRRRIQRGNEHFSSTRLGAFSGDLAALSGFFAAQWDQPVAGLREASRPFVLNAAGSCLRALGRLKEAESALQAGLEMRIKSNDWTDAALTAGNLGELCLTVGDLNRAIEFAQHSVEFSDRSGDQFQQMSNRTILADVLHQTGRAGEADAAFNESAAIQQEMQAEFPVLRSLQGFRYCDLLLDQGRVREVKEQAAQTLDRFKNVYSLLEIALDNLSLGRALLLEAQLADTGDSARAAEFLQRAVDGLRQAAQLDHLPRGLLARAALWRFVGDSERAERDLAEEIGIATRSGMGLYLADGHLESARCQLTQGNLGKAREHWETAKAMIGRMGYHRRDKEVREIAEKLH
jgi:tetratricopeptide (TPR) repeat protein